MSRIDRKADWLDRRPRQGDTCVFTHGYSGIASSRSDLGEIGDRRDVLYISCATVLSALGSGESGSC
jgi:hypothetical protein